jgi:hypothetical protein
VPGYPSLPRFDVSNRGSLFGGSEPRSINNTNSPKPSCTTPFFRSTDLSPYYEKSVETICGWIDLPGFFSIADYFEA